jgi:hypothetical protein
MKAGMAPDEQKQLDAAIATDINAVVPRFTREAFAVGKDPGTTAIEMVRPLHGLTAAEIQRKAVEAQQESQKDLERMVAALKARKAAMEKKTGGNAEQKGK